MELIEWDEMSELAWKARENSRIIGKTKVGCCVLSTDGGFYTGCNVEHKFRCHDIHAEVCALMNMVSGGGKKVSIVLIVAEREFFVPCGGCMDWIFELGSFDVMVAFQGSRGGKIATFKAEELMPHYPS